MSTLTIGSNLIEIISCTRMRDVQRGFYLDIKIPKGVVTLDELETLFDGNEEPILVVDGDGNENTYIGFKELSSLSLEKGVYRVCQVCTSEYEAQLSLAQSKLNQQETLISQMKSTIEEQEKELEAQASVVVAQGDTIAAQKKIIEDQNEQVVALTEMSSNQLEVLDFLLSEGISLIAKEVAETAVKELAETINSENKEEVEESEEI